MIGTTRGVARGVSRGIRVDATETPIPVNPPI